MNGLNQYEIAAYYFPQYHSDPRNDIWHGKGWTEWALLKAARPRFPGHRQPLVPAWGYFDEANPRWAAQEIDLAADHGITTFLYDWYWYEDKPFLQDGLEQGFLGASNNQRLKFALMWANHDWLNIFPARSSNQPAVLAPGHVSLAEFERMTDYIVERYFSRPNYLTINGEPYFSIYELSSFIAGLGGLDVTHTALERFRAKTSALGLPGLHLNAVVWGVSLLPREIARADPVQVITHLRFSSTTTYAWMHHYTPDSDDFPRASYSKAAECNYDAWEEYSHRFPVPYYPNVSMGWDSSPRTVQSERYEQRGYPWTAVFEGNTPAAFKAALQRAKTFLDRRGVEQKMLTINAWNEWTEGSYLLPDTVYGHAYLEAIREVFDSNAA